MAENENFTITYLQLRSISLFQVIGKSEKLIDFNVFMILEYLLTESKKSLKIVNSQLSIQNSIKFFKCVRKSIVYSENPRRRFWEYVIIFSVVTY